MTMPVIMIDIAVGAFAGLLAFGLATLLVRNKKENKRIYNGVVVAMMVVLIALSQAFVTPQLKSQYEAKEIDNSVSEIPAFAAIKQYDEAEYQQIMEKLKIAMSHGQGQAEAKADMKGYILAIVQKRLPHASDESVTKYMNVIIQETVQLQQKGGDLCYQFLFPQEGKSLDISKHITSATKQADLAALGEVIRTSATAPQDIPKEDVVTADLQTVFVALNKKHGKDVDILQNPGAQGVDKAKVCEVTVDMYTEIFKLPPVQSGKLLRYMLAL